MPAASGRRAAHLAAAVVAFVLLASGCGGKTPTSTTTPPPSASPVAETTAPATTTAAAGPLTGKELVWLEGIRRLHTKIDKVLANSPSDLTSTTMGAIANDLRGCSRGLAKLGSPSARLRPVYKLAKSGCAQYDKAASCFATAARIGAPVAGTAEEQTFNKALDCGFKTPEKGSKLLADAEIKGFAIKEKAG
jgi:hypothetical protein